MQALLETHQRLINTLEMPYKRQFYQQFKQDHRAMGIVGPRGVGKTTFLLHYIKTHYPGSSQALYVSADHLAFAEHSLWDVADWFHKTYDGKLLCIDEIHRYPEWNQILKNLYDAFPQMTILFSGSSSVDLIHGQYDLSRRAILKKMDGFSFREFLEVTQKQSLPTFKLDEIMQPSKAAQEILQIPKLLGHFQQYLQTGFYPFFLELNNEETYQQVLLNMVDKTIYQDISDFYQLKTQNLPTFKKILAFIATSQPGRFSINQIAKSLRKDHTTTAEYIEMLRATGLLRYLPKDKRGHALIRSAEKVYFSNTNLLSAYSQGLGKESEIGTLRECFTLQTLEQAGYNVTYSGQGDFSCENLVLEIGGRHKTRKQIAQSEQGIVLRDNSLTWEAQIAPLILLGFLS